MRTMHVFWKQVAFIRRGYLIESSYKAAFVLELGSSFFPVILFYFVGKLITTQVPRELEPYGGEYFPFALVGIGLSQFLSRALKMFSTSIRRAQMSGVLEASLSTQTQPAALVIYDSTFSFLMASAHLIFVFFVGSWLLGARFDNVNVVSVVVVGFLSLLTFVALGILAATAVIAIKKGDPVDFVFGSGALVLSGAYFPMAILPDSVRMVAQAFPLTHALEGLRRALFMRASLGELAVQLVVLGSFAAVLLPASLFMFHWAVEKGRRDGTLLHY